MTDSIPDPEPQAIELVRRLAPALASVLALGVEVHDDIPDPDAPEALQPIGIASDSIAWLANRLVLDYTHHELLQLLGLFRLLGAVSQGIESAFAMGML